MKLATPYRHRNREHLGALVDIVFLLLVFFMLAGRITSPDPLAVKPPESTAEAAVDQGEIRIVLTADGRVALNDKQVERDSLGLLLKPQLAAEPNATIDLKADAEVATGEVIRVMKVLRDAGVKSVHVLTQKANRRQDRP
jgi:biopolymer transport protein ExbD